MTKVATTKARILERAVRVSSLVGLEGLTLGRLAAELRLSKSGLYAHFQSKEELQLGIIQRAADDFLQDVVKPAIGLPRGEPRVLGLFDGWLRWATSGPLPGGCLFVAAATEWDDQEGPVRDELVNVQRGWLSVIARAARIARDEGHFVSDIEPEQLAFEIHGIMLSFHHQARLLREPDAVPRAKRAYAALSSRAHGGGEAFTYQELLAKHGVEPVGAARQQATAYEGSNAQTDPRKPSEKPS